MEQMKKRVWLAASLGILLGLALAYAPPVSTVTAPKTALFMQQAAQPNVAAPSPQPPNELLAVLIALAAGLVVAIPTFVLAKRRSQ
jgi:capsular polysaccharide biosynthesis protein